MVLPLVAAAALPALARVGMEAAPAVAEWLGRQIAGDPEVGERAAAVVRAVTGTDDPVQAEQAMADPGARSEVAQRLAELAVEQDRIAAADRANARARDVALHQAGARRVLPAAVLTLAAVGALCAGLALIYGGLDDGGAAQAAFIQALTVCLGLVVLAGQFEWGSSRGSRIKDEGNAGSFGQGKG